MVETFNRSARIDGQITSTTARKAAAIGTCGILIVSYCFLLIYFDVQDVVIDVHDFRLCACVCACVCDFCLARSVCVVCHEGHEGVGACEDYF